MNKTKILSISTLILVLLCSFVVSVQADELGAITVNPYKETIFGGKRTIREGVKVWAQNTQSKEIIEGYKYNGQYVISIPINEGASMEFTVYARYNEMTESESGVIVSSENPYPDTIQLEFNGGPISKIIDIPLIKAILGILIR